MGGWTWCGGGGGGVGGTCPAGSSSSTSRCEDGERGGTLLEVEDLALNGISAIRSARVQSESHVENWGSDEDAEYDNEETPDASALKLGSCLGKTESEARVSEERFMDNHSSLIFAAAALVG